MKLNNVQRVAAAFVIADCHLCVNCELDLQHNGYFQHKIMNGAHKTPRNTHTKVMTFLDVAVSLSVCLRNMFGL